jgi:hypothetical protein
VDTNISGEHGASCIRVRVFRVKNWLGYSQVGRKVVTHVHGRGEEIEMVNRKIMWH